MPEDDDAKMTTDNEQVNIVFTLPLLLFFLVPLPVCGVTGVSSYSILIKS